MEENEKQILHVECPGNLNLNVPPLSTRRPLAVKTNSMLTLVSNPKASVINMVPFSWERIPGEPKDKRTNEDIEPPPTPKLPPGWRPPTTTAIDPCCDDHHEKSSGDSLGKHGDHNECFSNAIDIFSLGESTYDMEPDGGDQATKDRSLEKMDHCSSNFIIERFLPDAQALAEASVINKKLLMPFVFSPDPSASFSRGEVGIESSSCHSPKGCGGLGSFLPWRMKPKPCSVKSPVCDTIIGVNPKKNH